MKNFWNKEIVICWLGMHEEVTDGWENGGSYTTKFFSKCRQCGVRWVRSIH